MPRSKRGIKSKPASPREYYLRARDNVNSDLDKFERGAGHKRGTHDPIKKETFANSPKKGKRKSK